MRSLLNTRARRVDAALCLAILALSVPPTLSGDPDVGADTWLDTLLLPVLLVPLLSRRRSLALGAAAFPVACVVSAVPTFDQIRLPAVVPVAMVLAFDLGRTASRREAWIGLALLFAGLVADGATEQVVDNNLVAVLAFGGPLATAALGGGRLVRSRERVAAELTATTLALEQRREATASLAVELERARLASDLDAAARLRVREIVELAVAAEHEAARPAGDVFAAIERMGRATLNDMRELLGVLRSDERARRSPGPTLAELDGLLADVRRGGRAVELEVQGERARLPDAVELAAYRTLQHAVAALRGDAGEPLAIVLRYHSDRLEVEARGVPVEGPAASAALAAAQERVRAQGGSFEHVAGATARDILRARLPLAGAHA